MKINHDRARIVFDTLVRALKRKVYPYNTALRPQDVVDGLANYSEKQQANFWFYACMYMRGPIDSNYAVETLFQIFTAQNGEGIFDPDDIRSQRPYHIVRVMEEHNFTRMLKDVRKFWSFGSQKISKFYGGDVRNIYKGVETFDDVLCRLTYSKETEMYTGTGFIGFQKKMAAMLTYFLYDYNLISFDRFPPPVDFHLMRVMILTEVLCLTNDEDPKGFRYERTSPYGFKAIEEYLKIPGKEPVQLGDALWLLSGNLCSESPRNREARSFGTFDDAKIDSTALSKKKPLQSHPGLFENTGVDLPIHIGDSFEMRTSCGRCPVNHLCMSNVGIPAVEYYRDGKLVLRPLVPSKNKA